LLTALLVAAPLADRARGDDPLSEAKVLRDKEDWAEAGAKFREAMEKGPAGPLAAEARFWAGYCLVKDGENESAVDLLAPFEADLADDTWADDALLQLGQARLARGDQGGARAAWERQVEKYPDSVWRLEVMLKLVDLHFYQTNDFNACLASSERVVAAFPNREGTAEARYAGAYSLNVLSRFAESERWAETNLDPENPLEEAWRRVLGAQRDFLKGRELDALAAIGSLDADFPDLDQEARLDLRLRTTHMLRCNGRADRARQLLVDELKRSDGRPEAEVESLLDELAEILNDPRGDFLEVLAQPWVLAAGPLVVRVVARERRAHLLIEANAVDPAVALLRQAIEKDLVEYARVRAALTLAEILAEHRDDRAGALKALEDLLPAIGRRDLAHQVRNAIEKYRPAAEAKP
jgi:TolA-binding protein